MHPTISSLNQQTDRPISTILSNVIKTILIRVLSPSTSKVLIPENPEKNQLTDNFISPIQSNKSDTDDSDKDPNFELPGNKRKLSKIKVISSSSTSSSSSSSSSDSNNSDSDTDDENVDISQNPTTSGVHEQEPITEEKKGKKQVRKPLIWKANVAKLLQNSGKAYHSLSKSKKQVPERKLRSPCGSNCRMKCNSNIDEPARHQLFNAFWELANLQRQGEFIVRHSQKIKPKYR